jgi:hypothetical protein
MGNGFIEVTSLRRITLAEVTPELARRCGFLGVNNAATLAKRFAKCGPCLDRLRHRVYALRGALVVLCAGIHQAPFCSEDFAALIFRDQNEMLLGGRDVVPGTMETEVCLVDAKQVSNFRLSRGLSRIVRTYCLLGRENQGRSRNWGSDRLNGPEPGFFQPFGDTHSS